MLSVNTGWRYLNIIFGGHTSEEDKLLASISSSERWEEFTIGGQTWWEERQY